MCTKQNELGELIKIRFWASLGKAGGSWELGPRGGSEGHL